MKNNVIKFTVNPLFTSLENIMNQVQQAAQGKIVDDIHVERISIFKSEIEVLLSSPKPIIKTVEVTKEVPVIQEVIKEIYVEVPAKPKTAKVKTKPVIKYKDNATSKYRGVVKNRNRYEVAIMHDKKRYYVGSYTNELEAARAYNETALKLKGDKAVLNEIEIDDVTNDSNKMFVKSLINAIERM